MKKTYIALSFLITGFLLAGDAYGEDEVYYCSEIDKTGFENNKKRGSYERAGYEVERFKMKLDMDSKRIELARDVGREIYTCSTIYFKQGVIGCMHDSVYHFNFNANNGRFVFSKGYGYVASDADSVSISYGKCDKF